MCGSTKIAYAIPFQRQNLLKEAQMKKTGLSIAGLSFLLGAFIFAVAPVRAQSVDDKIKNLEQELSQLKSQQIEMKKDAAAAAAALPEFSYRPGSGVRIEAADKAWALQLSHEIDWLMPFESGSAHADRTNGEVMTRRFRQEWTMCIDNCFYEVQSRLDLDGFGTQTDLQRAQGLLHFENLNPWLPTLYFGADIEMNGGAARQGSSATGSQAEYDLLSRNNGFNTGRTGTGIGLIYENINLGAIGVPGRARFQFMAGSIGAADDGASVPTDRKSLAAFWSMSPFSQLKNKWLSGLTFEILGFWCNTDPHLEDTTTSTASLAVSTTTGLITAGRIDTTTTTRIPAGQSACQSLNIRDNGPGGRQSLFNTGVITGGQGQYIQPGLLWEVGPYRLRAMMGFQHYDDNNSRDSVAIRQRDQLPIAGGAATTSTTSTFLGDVGKKSARVWLIGHDLFLWSPKGFLTGSSNTPGSVLFGTHFERTDVGCDTAGGIRTFPDNAVCNRVTLSGTTSASEFLHSRILLREWDLWYFIAPRASVGLNFMWYDANHLPTGFSSGSGFTNDVQKNLNVSGDCRNRAVNNGGSTPGAGSFVPLRLGCGGNWVDVWLRLRWSF
jgi:hypothetical protein